MTADNSQESTNRQQILADFRQQIANTVGTLPDNLGRSIKSAEHLLFDGGRYCCLINGPAGAETGFIKITHAQEPKLVQNLERETFVAQHASELGIPAVGCLTPPTPIGNEYLLIQLQVLSPEDGATYLGMEMHSSAPLETATKGTDALLSLYRKAIPSEIDTSMLDRQHERNASPEAFSATWQNQNEIIFDPVNQETVASLCQTAPETNDGANNLHQIVETSQGYLDDLIAKGQDDSHEYLSQGDADLNNMFFKNNGEVVLIDWETATASHNWFLAQLTDLSNMFGRCWVDPEKQHLVLSTILKSDCFDDLQTRYQVAYTVAVYGSMYLAKYGMDPTNHEHQMSLSLLGNLQDNLNYLDSEYQSLSQPQSPDR